MDAPYFPFYPYDWLSDPNVQQLTLEEAGAYINLLSYMWVNGSGCTLPNDDRFLSRVLHVPPDKWKELREVLVDSSGAVFLQREDGSLYNKRLSAEYEKAVDKISKKVAAAQKRWSTADAMQMECTSNAPAMQKQGYTDPDTDPDTDKEKKIKEPPVVDHVTVELHRVYEQTFGRLPNKVQLDYLHEYTDKGMDLELVFQAMKTARMNTAGINYALKILERQLDAGIMTVAQAEQSEAERQTAATVRKGDVKGGTRKQSVESDDEWQRIEENFYK